MRATRWRMLSTARRGCIMAARARIACETRGRHFGPRERAHVHADAAIGGIDLGVRRVFLDAPADVLRVIGRQFAVEVGGDEFADFLLLAYTVPLRILILQRCVKTEFDRVLPKLLAGPEEHRFHGGSRDPHHLADVLAGKPLIFAKYQRLLIARRTCD